MKDVLLNFKDNVGTFITRVKLSNNIMYDEDSGWLYCNNVILGNIGVQQYYGYELGFEEKNKVITVQRTADEVFNEDSLKTAEGIPVTLRHPKKMLNAYTATDHIKGAVYGDVKVDGDNMVSNLVIYDKDTIDLVAPLNDSGERELNPKFRDLSLGYKSKLVAIDEAGGVYKQTNIRYNHLAIVEAGRQVNATIVDSKNVGEEEKPKMGVFARLLGRKVTKNEETNETIIGDEQVEIELDIEDARKTISKYESKSISEREDWDDPEKKIVTKTETKEIVEKVDKDDPTMFDKEGKPIEPNDEEKPKDKENQDEKEKEKEMKDVKYFNDELVKAHALPDGIIKTATILKLEQEFADTFPELAEAAKKEIEIKDEKPNAPIKPVNLDGDIDVNDGKFVFDYQKFEEESRQYYDRLTNPFAHNSWDEFNQNYESEKRKGRYQER